MTQPKRWTFWAGWIISALPIGMLLMSATMKFMAKPEVIDAFTGKFGYLKDSLFPIGVVELACALLYAIPQTSVLGAILVTGYLGGATATHVRVGDAFITPIVLGMIAWLGLYLRDQRIRDLIPIRKCSSTPREVTA